VSPALYCNPSKESLRSYLLTTVDLLKRRRAAAIPESFIDRYVVLQWLEWHGGNLRLTTIGRNICAQLMAAAQAALHPA
jgi:hypothetical protein